MHDLERNIKTVFPGVSDKEFFLLLGEDNSLKSKFCQSRQLTLNELEQILTKARSNSLFCEMPGQESRDYSAQDHAGRMSGTYDFPDRERDHFPPTHAPEDQGYDAGYKRNHAENDGRY